jgi:hypothetical protein
MHRTMMTYIFMIDSILSTCPKLLVHIIPTMERTQGLLGTLEVVFDEQALPVWRVFTIINLSNVVYQALLPNVVSIYV